MTIVPLTVRPVEVLPGPVTGPLPRVTDLVHGVTATFSGSGWTLRFGPGDDRAVVARLAGADAAARGLVATCLGVPAADVRIRIVPDAGELAALRRRTPWWRGRAQEV